MILREVGNIVIWTEINFAAYMLVQDKREHANIQAPNFYSPGNFKDKKRHLHIFWRKIILYSMPDDMAGFDGTLP